MCGIGGIYSSNGNIKTEDIETLFLNIESRGIDACGISYLWNDADKPIISKAPIRAKSFIFKNGIKKIGNKMDWIMLHTRLTTQGSKQNNFNNHPVVRNNIILTHNGVLWNDDEIFNKLKTKRIGEVDTEALLVALNVKGLQYLAEHVEGSISIAWTTKNDKVGYNTMNWFTNGGNPLVIGRLKDKSIVWASLPEHFNGLDVVEYFWANPFKHYWTNGDGIIHSKFISDMRRAPAYGQSRIEKIVEEETWDWEEFFFN